jgi:hypothetical protein
VNVSNPLSGTGHGAVDFYNFGCEIQNHISPNLNGDNWVVLTSSNIWNVPSLFDATEASGPQSMSQVTFLNPVGGGGAYAFLLDGAYTVNILGGYFNGGNSTAYPWAVGVENQVGHIWIDGFRTELRSGFLYGFPGATINESKVWVDAYRQNATTAQVFLDTGSYINNSSFTVDDYGGSSTNAPLVTAVTPCGVLNSTLFVGVHETFDVLGCAGGNNVIVNTNTGVTNTSGASVIATPTGVQQTLANPNLMGTIAVSQYFVPGATSPATSAYGARYVFGWTANGCGTGQPDFSLINGSDGCVLRYQQNTKVLHVGPTDSGTISGAGFTSGFTGTKTVGACVMTITNGIITNVTGC